MNIVILAAGQGKRMRSSKAKVLHSVAGRPMLAHVIDTALAAAFTTNAQIVVVVGHAAQSVQEAFPASDLRFVTQQPQLGTGHAVLQAVPLLDDRVPTLVLLGDVPLITAATLTRLVERAGDGVAVLSVRLQDPTGYGRIVRDDAGRLARIAEQRDASEAERALDEVSTGILVAPTAPLKRWLARLTNDNAQHEYYLPDILPQALAEGVAVHVLELEDPGEALGVNSPQQLATVERILQRRAAEALLESGVTLADPARIDIRGKLITGRDVAIDIGCVFEGEVTLGDGVRVGAYCVVRDSVLENGAELLPFCHVDGSRVGPAARIGPYARLRPGAVLADEVHIGNFVEVKASSLGRGSKANHLAYVGDAVVGSNVNIGAGTITANYDGANKHRTEIGDDASIGSNAVLVAPVKIGRGATIGGGSTIAKDAPEDKLTVARARQVTLNHWARPSKKKG
jgi:bifunctional UDP-N-acetylglucosamine pyrophosphorylase / glucosamine-1-phosphate N-acetyltransferase